MDRARETCERQGIRWTALRERVFREIALRHEPISAYDLIDELAASGKRLAPISVYRILEVLQKAGLIHRIESRNAFFACAGGHDMRMPSVVFLCTACNRVAEADAPKAVEQLAEALARKRFQITTTVFEISGICEDCGKPTAFSRD
jgi:Fur family zinc uptake transcriptional regulator